MECGPPGPLHGLSLTSTDRGTDSTDRLLLAHAPEPDLSSWPRLEHLLRGAGCELCVGGRDEGLQACLSPAETWEPTALDRDSGHQQARGP